jgi:hypothetical protein
MISVKGIEDRRIMASAAPEEPALKLVWLVAAETSKKPLLV